jgi:gamma-glutamyltranspeptidase/glutathione hydrolase
MVATSSPEATEAGLRMLRRGGTAADAALAAAAMLCVAEPMCTGLGGDVFALVQADGAIFGLDAAGPAPRAADPSAPVERSGPRSVTVPGAAAGWALLSQRFGRLGLEQCLADAIDAAERGCVVHEKSASMWGAIGSCPAELLPAPRAGEIVRMPALAQTLRAVARHGPEAIYEGPIASAICAASWLEPADLASYRASWVEPMRTGYRESEVIEMPPPSQGIVALEALALLETMEPTLSNVVRCVQLALEDGIANVRDGAEVGHLLAAAFLDQRRNADPRPVEPVDAGTVYLSVADDHGMTVSFIQSLFQSFGSKIVAPGTGVVLQNRGAGFTVSGGVQPGLRPYHTIIPGMLLEADGSVTAFGVVGGHLQAQAHTQIVSALVDDNAGPQAAIDRPRFRIEGQDILLERGLWPYAHTLAAHGRCILSDDANRFGWGQIVSSLDGQIRGGSDSRMDGCAAGP